MIEGDRNFLLAHSHCIAVREAVQEVEIEVLNAQTMKIMECLLKITQISCIQI